MDCVITKGRIIMMSALQRKWCRSESSRWVGIFHASQKISYGFENSRKIVESYIFKIKIQFTLPILSDKIAEHREAFIQQ